MIVLITFLVDRFVYLFISSHYIGHNEDIVIYHLCTAQHIGVLFGSQAATSLCCKTLTKEL